MYLIFPAMIYHCKNQIRLKMAAWWVINFFQLYSPFPKDNTIQASCYSIIVNVQTRYIPKFDLYSWGPPSHVHSRVESSAFLSTYIGKKEDPLWLPLSQEPLVCGTDSPVDAFLETTILTSSSLWSLVSFILIICTCFLLLCPCNNPSQEPSTLRGSIGLYFFFKHLVKISAEMTIPVSQRFTSDLSQMVHFWIKVLNIYRGKKSKRITDKSSKNTC